MHLFSRQHGGRVTTTEDQAREPRTGDHGASPEFAENFEALTANIQRAIKGKDDIVHLLVLALVADGHVLVEDVPGVGKTSIAKALARSVDGKFGRVQFTPDLLPTDVTGVSVWNRGADVFEFRPGPVFADILLADEINRASPKTQSALLEAMGERQVTTDGITHQLGAPFMVIATQNPIEHEGTYALPEAQLDRFLMRLEIGYPGRDAEREILETHGDNIEPADSLPTVVTAEQVNEMSASLQSIYLAPALRDYLLDLAAATRRHTSLALGLSPRGLLALQRVVRAQAASQGRTYATPDDVKMMAPYVLSHRLLTTPESRMHGLRTADVVTEILDGVPVPRPSGS
jgi:MoxR-like ATPase